MRLTQGDYSREKVYSDDPVSMAKGFEQAGATRLHLVDLEGAKAACPKNLDVLRNITKATGLKVEFGGGVKSEESLNAVLDAGAEYVICGSVAFTEPDIFKKWLGAMGKNHPWVGFEEWFGRDARLEGDCPDVSRAGFGVF